MKFRNLTLILFVACCLVAGLSWAAPASDSLEPVTEQTAETETHEEVEVETDVYEYDFDGEISWVGPGGDCLADCRIEQQSCLAGCNGNSACIAFCFSEYNSCKTSCTG